jgi:hypothetical protein
MAYDEVKNMAVIEVTVNAAQDLAKRFGFEVEHGGEKMLALQSCFYEIFGQEISSGILRD